MDQQDRNKWLYWSKLGLSMPRKKEENIGNIPKANIQESVHRILQRQNQIENKFNSYLGQQNNGKYLPTPKGNIYKAKQKQNQRGDKLKRTYTTPCYWFTVAVLCKNNNIKIDVELLRIFIFNQFN